MTAMIRAMTLQELRARGAPQVFETAPDAWRQRLIDWWETDPAGPRRKIYPAQVEMLFIDLLAYALSLLGQQGQMAVEQRWAAFAGGAHLDMLGANVSTFRLKAAPAQTTLRFTLPAAAPEDRVIPAGTLASAGGDAPAFATDADLVIPAGEVMGEVAATCTVPGSIGNGFLPGQINELITPLPFDMVAQNTTESAGGAAEESDDAYRLRIAQAFERISKAGPRAAYEQAVRAYSPAIIDVAVIRPEPGVIHVYPLADTGAPGPDVLAGILAWLDPVSMRPQGDDVHVLPPQAVSVAITANVRASGDLAVVQQQVDDAIRNAATAWSRRLGQYLSLSAISCAVQAVPGVIDADLVLTGLAGRQLQPHQFAVLTGVSVNITGVEA